jgi:YidC/Oxa1 family membrane protein insertase
VQPILNFFSIIFYGPIFNALILLYQGVHDYGLAIIILTLAIRFALIPLTFQQLRASKVMQELQPKLRELQRRYAHDKERLMREQMALYREHKYNPALGCLPLLIQLPFLYGLFYALRNVPVTSLTGLNQQIYPFLPKLAAKPNTYLNWFAFLPGGPHLNLAVPDPTHVLPIIAAVATFAQMRMAQPRQVVQRSDKDAQTAVMSQMSYIMPIITGFFAWTFPAGLALYWTISTLFTMVQQYFITGWGSLPTIIPGLRLGAHGSANTGAPAASSPQKLVAGKEADGTKAWADKARRPGDGKAEGGGASYSVTTPAEADSADTRLSRPASGSSSVPPSFGTTRRERGGSNRGMPRNRNGTARRSRPVSKPKGGKQ